MNNINNVQENTIIAKEAKTMFKYEAGISEKVINTLENIYKMAKDGVAYALPPVRDFNGDFGKQVEASLRNATVEKAAELERKGRGIILDIFEGHDIISKKDKKAIFATKNSLDKIYRVLKSGTTYNLDNVVIEEEPVVEEINQAVKEEVIEVKETTAEVKEAEVVTEPKAEEPIVATETVIEAKAKEEPTIEVKETEEVKTKNEAINKVHDIVTETLSSITESSDTAVVLSPVVAENSKEEVVTKPVQVKEKSDGPLVIDGVVQNMIDYDGNPYHAPTPEEEQAEETMRAKYWKDEAKAEEEGFKEAKEEMERAAHPVYEIERPHTIVGFYYMHSGHKLPAWEIHSEDINGEKIRLTDRRLPSYYRFVEAHPENFDLVEVFSLENPEIIKDKLPEKFKAVFGKAPVETKAKAEPVTEVKAEIEVKVAEEPAKEPVQEVKAAPAVEAKVVETKEPVTEVKTETVTEAKPAAEPTVCDKVIPAGKIGCDIDAGGSVRYIYDKNGNRTKLSGTYSVKSTTNDYKQHPEKYFTVLWLYGGGSIGFYTSEELQEYRKTQTGTGVKPADTLRVEQINLENRTADGVVKVTVDDRPDVNSMTLSQAVEAAIEGGGVIDPEAARAQAAAMEGSDSVTLRGEGF